MLKGLEINLGCDYGQLGGLPRNDLSSQQLQEMNIVSIDFWIYSCNHYAPASCQGPARARSWGKPGGEGGPSAGSALTHGAQSHRVWAWQAEPGASNRVCWQSQARWSNEAPSRSLKDGAGDKATAWVQSPPRRQGQRQDWLQASLYIQEVFPGDKLPTALSQSRRQGQRQGCRWVHLQQSSCKEQRPRPELKWGCWTIGRGRGWRSHVRLVCAVKGSWCSQRPDTSSSLVGQMKRCLLYTLSCLTSFSDITGSYKKAALFHWRGRKGFSHICLFWPQKFLSSRR